MKKILVLIYPTFAEFEITVATAALKDSYVVETVGLTKEIIVSETGLQVKPHYELSEICIDDYEGIIIPGGDVVHVKDSELLFELIRQMYKVKKMIAAICAGPFVLARSGILQHVPYTVTLDYRQLDCFSKEHFIYKEVVRHQNIITAQGHAFVEFGLAIAEYCKVHTEHKNDFYCGKRNIVMENVLK